jgi:virginiamycin B lyase
MAGNQILFFYTNMGEFVEIPMSTIESEPYGIAMEDNAAIWFTERAGNKLGRYAGPSPPREYSLPTQNSAPTGIVVDGNGCAWYTAPGANRIGRLCPPLNYLAYLPFVSHSQVP